MKRRMRLLLTFLLAFMIVAPGAASAQSKEEAERIIEKSRIVVEEMMASRDSVVPEDLLRDCAGLAIIPEMIKGGFIIGGSYGKAWFWHMTANGQDLRLSTWVQKSGFQIGVEMVT
jgi:lipid-binding SYLF domain-containing protein